MWQSNSTLDAGTLLRRAAAEGDVDKVRSLLDDKNFINHKSSNGNTALHWSIVNKHYAVTKLLLTLSGIHVDAKNKQGDTPLHLATKQDDKKTVYRLLKVGAGKKNITDKKGFSPLDYALDKNCSFIVAKLKQMLPNMTFKNDDQLAEQAYEKFKTNNPNLLRNKKIFDPNYLCNDKVARYFLPGNPFTLVAIQAAIERGVLNPHKLFCSGNLLQSAAVSRVDTCEKFRWLLEQDVDPNLQTCHEINPCSYKNTALHTLIANEDEKDALVFIDMLNTNQKFNFNLTDNEGKTCLCLATKVGLSNVAKKLIKLKDRVDVNVPDEDGNTPLHYALLLGHSSIATELLAHQANKNAKNKENKNPYELLISTDSEDVRDCLEITWINPDKKVKPSRKTYIQLCMENRERAKNEWVTIFSNINLPIANKRKSIGFLLAAATGDLTKLKDHCDSFTLNQVNAKGNTALHLACDRGHDEIIKYLLEQPEVNLDKKNNENIKAIDLLSNPLLATLFKEKFFGIEEKTTEDKKDNGNRLVQDSGTLSNKTNGL
ncbi:MAG: ankyrin repeat domain-containing protein [Gammaproteobacteria bacterium]|nr:ankyrin repeat domain-containing protein [Gammaproteobacteria bacterium]